MARTVNRQGSFSSSKDLNDPTIWAEKGVERAFFEKVRIWNGRGDIHKKAGQSEEYSRIQDSLIHIVGRNHLLQAADFPARSRPDICHGVYRIF
jgi:hypothetical protein